MRAELTRFGFNVITGLILIGMCINLGARLGLPTYSLVTGLGVGGLAVALAGREALSNLIGTIAILLDQPFKLGDFIVLWRRRSWHSCGDRSSEHPHRNKGWDTGVHP